MGSGVVVAGLVEVVQPVVFTQAALVADSPTKPAMISAGVAPGVTGRLLGSELRVGAAAGGVAGLGALHQPAAMDPAEPGAVRVQAGQLAAIGGGGHGGDPAGADGTSLAAEAVKLGQQVCR
jgi:hypothetical protein